MYYLTVACEGFFKDPVCYTDSSNNQLQYNDTLQWTPQNQKLGFKLLFTAMQMYVFIFLQVIMYGGRTWCHNLYNFA